MEVYVASRKLLQDLTGSLHLPICLRVVGRQEAGVDAPNLERFSPEVEDKLSTLVRDNVLQEAMEGVHLVHPEHDHFLREG